MNRAKAQSVGKNKRQKKTQKQLTIESGVKFHYKSHLNCILNCLELEMKSPLVLQTFCSAGSCSKERCLALPSKTGHIQSRITAPSQLIPNRLCFFPKLDVLKDLGVLNY